MLSAAQLLQKYWGFSSFRSSQEQIIESVMARNSVFAILPTGGGKSLCYQLPAVALPGMALIISPLIALMQDQVSQLQKKGISAALINSTQHREEQEEILGRCSDGILKLLFVAPERLQTQRFKEYAQQWDISFLAVDEAHCISQWGHDFRPVYRQILVFAKEMQIQQILAFTASATPAVKKDIIAQLNLEKAPTYIESVVRPNLAYYVHYTEDKLGTTLSLLASNPASSIVYCRTRMKTVEVAQYLNVHQLPTLIYHAGLLHPQRKQAQHQWTKADNMCMASTTAFGMGIDKPDVRQVVHISSSYSLEEYYQEAGRAGRDEQYARASLLFHHQDISLMERSVEEQFPPALELLDIYLAICNFLQIAVNDGAEQLYFFDVVRFSSNFKYPIIKVLRVLSILGQEGYWIFNNDDSTRTLIQFTCERQDLEHLDRYQPALSRIATQLLRLHGSILYYPTAVSIFEDAKTMGITFSEMESGLLKLQEIGLLQYAPATTGSSLYFLHGRLHKSNFRLSHKRIAALKHAYEQRIGAMIAYIRCDTVCRSVQIAKYFGEQNIVPCGICDVCVEKSQVQLSVADLKMYLSQNKTTPLHQLITDFHLQSKNYLHQQVNMLISEGYCIMQGNDIIFR